MIQISIPKDRVIFDYTFKKIDYFVFDFLLDQAFPFQKPQIMC